MTPPPRVISKWRPPLALIIYTVLLIVMLLPVIIIALFRAYRATANSMAFADLTALLIALALTVIVAYVLTRTITSPINSLVSRTDAIGRCGKSEIQPLDSYGTREIATLSQSFLDLATKLVDRTEYVHSFAMHVSHELKSPLTAIQGAAELLRDDAVDEPMSQVQRQRFLDNIIADTRRLDLLLSRLRELSSADLLVVGGQTTVDVVLSQMRQQFPALDITSCGATSSSWAIPIEAMTIIMSNLAENAVQHGANALSVTVSSNEQMIKMIVQDNGRGIAQSNKANIFQPFFSTRKAEGGTGMGLAIVRSMLRTFNGTIELADTMNGAAFEISAPLGSRLS
ncbi:sensor histidine kinase [Oryzifoliimicrobium ureilyticus]|uniref:sensor histidine kinase n=1 Tax=Oryzifoliimicrobium ureilyticus TaxID=3113724 RepID=UPI0030763CE6